MSPFVSLAECAGSDIMMGWPVCVSLSSFSPNWSYPGTKGSMPPLVFVRPGITTLSQFVGKCGSPNPTLASEISITSLWKSNMTGLMYKRTLSHIFVPEGSWCCPTLCHRKYDLIMLCSIVFPWQKLNSVPVLFTVLENHMPQRAVGGGEFVSQVFLLSTPWRPVRVSVSSWFHTDGTEWDNTLL